MANDNNVLWDSWNPGYAFTNPNDPPGITNDPAHMPYNTVATLNNWKTIINAEPGMANRGQIITTHPKPH